MPGVRPEIWAFGFRNPWKMSFDRPTGDLWVGDVGWELWELVFKVKRGGNYGWSVMEGPQPVNVEAHRGPTPILPPIKVHPHSEAASITGGYVYHGTRLPELAGAYIYGDYQSGMIWGLRNQGETVTWQRELARTPLHLVAFGESHDGELYLLDHDRTQQIYRLVPNTTARTTNDFPRRLSQTGLFHSTRDHQPAAGVVPYSINAPLWSDGMTAERFLAVPGEGRIERDKQGIWRFPAGSVLGRTVSIEREPGKRTSRQRVETQILHLEADAWRPYSYVWNDDQTDAVLIGAEGTSRTIAVKTPDGRRDVNYRVPARTECGSCHNPWVEKRTTMFGVQSASPLGVNTPQLNRKSGDGREPANQLARWHQMGLLAWTPDLAALPKLVDPYDESADLDRRGALVPASELRPLSSAQCRRHGQDRPWLRFATGPNADGRRTADSGDVSDRWCADHCARRSRELGVVLPDVETGWWAHAAGRLKRGRRACHADDSRLDRPDAA